MISRHLICSSNLMWRIPSLPRLPIYSGKKKIRFSWLKEVCVCMQIRLTGRNVGFEYTGKRNRMATASSSMVSPIATKPPKENRPQLRETIKFRQQCQNWWQSFWKNRYLLRNIRSLQPFSLHSESFCYVIEGQVRHKASSTRRKSVSFDIPNSFFSKGSYGANPLQLFCHHE